MSTDQTFKPGYEGRRPSAVTTAPERQTLRQAKPEILRRLHEAMLTLSAMDGLASLGIEVGGVPEHIVEFADRVGEERADLKLTRFRPSAAQVSSLDANLALMEGLESDYFKVMLLRSLYLFAKVNGEESPWSWKAIGGKFDKSERWAEAVYERTIIMAARRAGVLPMTSRDCAVLIASAWFDGGWMTNLSTADNPAQSLANLKVKSPVKVSEAAAFWVAGPPVAKRLAEAIRKATWTMKSHGSWYKCPIETLGDYALIAASACDIEAFQEDLVVRGREAA
jgi:hypothetical protein